MNKFTPKNKIHTHTHYYLICCFVTDNQNEKRKKNLRKNIHQFWFGIAIYLLNFFWWIKGQNHHTQSKEKGRKPKNYNGNIQRIIGSDIPNKTKFTQSVQRSGFKIRALFFCERSDLQIWFRLLDAFVFFWLNLASRFFCSFFWFSQIFRFVIFRFNYFSVCWSCDSNQNVIL